MSDKMSDNPVVNGSVVFEQEVLGLAPEPVQLRFPFMGLTFYENEVLAGRIRDRPGYWRR